MWSNRLSLVAIILWISLVSCRPAAPTDKDLKVISHVDKIEETDLIGANIDSLLFQMYNNIIKVRLENLLQGVDSPKSESTDGVDILSKSEFHAGSLSLSSSDIVSELESTITRENPSEKIQVLLPIPVTEIPLKIFTLLPGIFKTFPVFLDFKVK